MRTWLYRIAANACLSALEGRVAAAAAVRGWARRATTRARRWPRLEMPWLEPFPDARYDVGHGRTCGWRWSRHSVLPPRQRAVLVLREVLQFSAAEVAGQLGDHGPGREQRAAAGQCGWPAPGICGEVV